MIIIDILRFNNLDEFVCEVYEKYGEISECDDLGSVEVIAKWDGAHQIVKGLITNFDLDIALISEFESPEVEGYDCEYSIIIDDRGIWVEHEKNEKGYSYSKADVTYLLDNCNSKIIPYIRSNKVYEVYIGCEDDECLDNIHDYSYSSTYYNVNGKEVSKDEYEKFVERFHDKYMDNVANMLLDYSSFMDELNECKKLFEI